MHLRLTGRPACGKAILAKTNLIPRRNPRALVRLRSPFPRTIPSKVEGLARGMNTHYFLLGREPRPCQRSWRGRRAPLLNSITAKVARQLDKMAKELGLSEHILIENASSNLAEAVSSFNLGKKVLVIAGKGNNGADVLGCARKLLSRGFSVKAAILEEEPLSHETLWQKNILEKIKCPVYPIKNDNVSQLAKLSKDRDFIIDGVLGIGAKGELNSFLKEVISLINRSKKKVVACDIPSGLSPDEGIILGAAVKADYTVTFLAAKEGFFLNQGKDLCGKIVVVDIGISKDILEKRR